MTIPAAGTVTHNGAAMAAGAGSNNRGELDALNLACGYADQLQFGVTGPVSLASRVFASPRDVTFAAAYDRTPPLGLTGSPTRPVSKACLAAECRAASDDLTGTWQVTVLGFYGTELQARLVEQAGALSGELSFYGGYSVLDRGTRNGADVSFTTSYYNPTRYTARLESPCRMSGTMEVFGYYTAPFIAIR